MQDRVRELFEVLMQRKEGEDLVRIDAGKGLEEVQKKIREEIDRSMEQVDREKLPLKFMEEW